MFDRIFGRRRAVVGSTSGSTSESSAPDPSTPEEAIVRILDKACDDIAFPMLDNGYVYLAASRLSLHRSADDWVLAFEIFGFSPRGGAPDLSVWSIGSRLEGRHPRADYADQAAHERYLAVHAHDDATFFFPIGGDWQDPDDPEQASPSGGVVLVRDRPIPIPPREVFAQHGITLVEPDRIRTYEVCRYVAAVARDQVLATPTERRVHVPPDCQELLVLDDWHHPDTAAGEHAGATAAFRSIARVLVTGDPSLYDASEPPNTHWSNWPMGGTL